MLKFIRYDYGERIYRYYWKFDESKLSESAKELCTIICNQLCKKNNKPYGTISGEDLDKYHTYYLYHGFAGDDFCYEISVGLLIDNFNVWDYAADILADYKKQFENNNSVDIFEIIKEFMMYTEVFGGDDITGGYVEFSEEDCVFLGCQ